MKFRVYLFVFFVIAICISSHAKEHVLTLDHSNFAQTVAKHDFIVVEFYAPWCGHCKTLAPEYESAASALSSHNPPIILAKVDVNNDKNKGLASEYDVKGFPTLKIFRDGGMVVQDYKGPRETEGIIDYLKKQSGPGSVEIKSAEDAKAVINEKKIVVVGVFPEFSGEKFQNFMALTEKLRSEYLFGHTLDAKFLPHGESSVSGPIVRLFKPFDELIVDSQDFNLDTLLKFVEEASAPLVTLFNQDPDNHPFVSKFFNRPNAKAMLFMNFSSELLNTFKSKYHEVAKQYKGQGISFLLGDVKSSHGALEYFGLKDDQAPLIIVQTNHGQKYFKQHLQPDEISSWVKEYMAGNVPVFRKSQPIPETNNEPVKVVVADTFEDMILNSGRDVFLEFYAPWCSHCKKLAPILDEVAVSFQNDVAIVIAKMDATSNDIPSAEFDVQGYPTLYFRSAAGTLSKYDKGRTKEAIIGFIQKNRHSTAPDYEL